MKIGIDIDGVMYQWSKTARYMLREVLPNSPYTAEGPLGTESTSWNYIADNVLEEHWNWLWTEGVRLGLFRYGNLYPGTAKAMQELAKLGDLIAITHRPKAAVTDTLAWLAYNNFPLSGVHILTEQQPKSTVRPMCDVYIDDKPENVNDLVRNTSGRVAMPIRPWNERQPIDDDVEIVFGWDQFIEFVKESK